MTTRFLTGLAFLISLSALPVSAADDAARGFNACIDLSRMATTKAVDNKTIVVTLRGQGGYRKIALAGNCVGLKIQDGFSYDASLAKLCAGDIITVLGGGGDRCGISEITPLAPADAKAMLTKR